MFMSCNVTLLSKTFRGEHSDTAGAFIAPYVPFLSTFYYKQRIVTGTLPSARVQSVLSDILLSLSPCLRLTLEAVKCAAFIQDS